MQRFHNIYEKQREFENLIISKSKSLPNKLLSEFDEKEKVAFSKELILLTHTELGELIDAIGNFKLHKTQKDSGEGKSVIDEIADCLIFILNLSLTHGFSSEQLLEAIEKKQQINFKRQEEGY